MKKILTTLICTVLLVAAQQSVFAQAAQSAAAGYKISEDILYKGSTDAYSNEMCILNVASPQQLGEGKHPVIVWFHGGGLTSGRRECPAALQTRGNVVVGVGYRFVSKVDLDETIDDAAAAVAWVVKNIASYGGDPEQIYLAGHSAGGYLCDMIALDKHFLGKYGVDPDKFAAIVPYSGQVITHFAQRSKNGIPELTPTIDKYAPLFHVRGDAAPFLVISGDREQELYGRYEETAYFVRMMKLNGHKDITFMEEDGFSHNDMFIPAHNILVKYIQQRSRNRK